MELKMFFSALALKFDRISLVDQSQRRSIFKLGYVMMANPLMVRLKAKEDKWIVYCCIVGTSCM